MEKPAQNSRTLRSFGQVRGVLAQRPLVLLEITAAGPVKRQVDQAGNRFVASPGAGQGQGEERRDRVVPGELLARFTAMTGPACRYFLLTAGWVMRYASDMRYPDSDERTAAERARRD
jgi:hypothetical protein